MKLQIPTAENGGLAMLADLSQADISTLVAIEPYYFKFRVTAAAVPIFERFLASPILANRRHALIGLIRYNPTVGYELEALLLHTCGIVDRCDVDDIVGSGLLVLLAARGSRVARKILLALINDQGWVDSYCDGFLLFKAQHLGSLSLEELFDKFIAEIAQNWPLVRGSHEI